MTPPDGLESIVIGALIGAVELLWPYALVLIVILALFGLLRRWLKASKGRRHERHVERALERRGMEALHDVYVPTERGVTQIDHVAKLPKGLVCIETKGWMGAIYGSATSRQWHRHLGREKYSDLNPLLQNAHHLKALRRHVDPVPCDGLVILTDPTARLKNGPFDGVIYLRDLRATLRDHPFQADDPDPAVVGAFERLRQVQQAHGSEWARQHAEHNNYKVARKHRLPKAS